ncbi:DNA cytosine methyltransferase [Streptomyces sp. NPDC047082]|uniref:DNA cytosine methyltransferase n=1 Tax=Streptomyces sp. NPDC047082 TaxID=3155259 RepID=UPI0033C604BD
MSQLALSLPASDSIPGPHLVAPSPTGAYDERVADRTDMFAADAAVQEAEDAAALLAAAGHPALVECQQTADLLTAHAATHPDDEAQAWAFEATERVIQCAYAIAEGDDERAATCARQAKRDRAAITLDTLESQGQVTAERLATLDPTTRELLTWYAAPFPLRWLFPPNKDRRGRIIRPRVVVLFHGPGGLSLGLLRILGVDFDVIGVDWDGGAVATATAAGFHVIHANVTDLDPENPALQHVTGIALTPPCQAFTQAGLRKGHYESAITLIESVILDASAAAGFYPWHESPSGYAPRLNMTWDEVREPLARLEDERAGLMTEVVIWPLAMLTRGSSVEWVVVEQSSALPARIENALLDQFTQAGWATTEAWTLDAVTYGSASHRKRRFMAAYRTTTPVVSLTPAEPFPVTTFAQCAGWPAGRTILTRGNRPVDPDTGRAKGGGSRSADRPSTCVTATIYGWADAETGERITQEDIGRLVGFPGAYPWRHVGRGKGTRNKAQQAADAVCPMVAAALFARVLGIPDWEMKTRAYVHELYGIRTRHAAAPAYLRSAYGVPLSG